MTTPTKKTMTGAELKVQLDGLGLPPSWFADRNNVTMRTVVRWFDGTAVPASAVDEIERISERTLDEMRKIIDSIDGDDVVLHTYRTDKEFKNRLDYPASWHRQMIFRVREHLEAEGRTVTVEYR
jgi:hypothetical protein